MKHTAGACVIMSVSLALVSSGVAAETIKVGVMDQQVVIEQSKAGKRALEELKAYSTTRQKIINADDQELKELEQVIQGGNLTEAIKSDKQGQFQTKVEAYQRRMADFNREIQKKQRDLISEYAKKVATAAQGVAEKNGYTAILDKGNEGMVKIVLYHQRALDVTDQVVKAFDLENK